MLTVQRIEQVLGLRNIEFFVISFNDHRPVEYEQVMKLPYARTLKHLDQPYEFQQQGAIPFPIFLSRVGDGTDADREFIDWCNDRYPNFTVSVYPRGDWMGMTPTSSFEVPDVGCRQWFQLHILASGNDAFCCIDAEGQFGFGNNVGSMHLLEMYNLPERRAIRERAVYRQSLSQCSSCTMFP